MKIKIPTINNTDRNMEEKKNAVEFHCSKENIHKNLFEKCVYIYVVI